MDKSKGISSKSPSPFLWGGVTTAFSLSITLVASRHFKQIAQYQKWTIGASYERETALKEGASP